MAVTESYLSYKEGKLGGEMLAEAALGIDNDEELDAEITLVHQPYYAPIENYVLAFMFILKLCNSRAYHCAESSLGLGLLTEMNYIKLGKQKPAAKPSKPASPKGKEAGEAEIKKFIENLY